ncbi:DUF1643 domain-containing protein [Exiguobacterium sp. R-17]|uniref:DUF1643 domain-containing protein n=1 Tax=Exiguobacterium sp. R-17 TaxID=3404054 RepID=UPI003CED90AB
MFKPWDKQYRVQAVLDEKRIYRYQFSCEWGNSGKHVTFLMLNPSQGNQGQDDRTLQRCISYAKSWGYDGLHVINVFAYISTSPEIIKSVAEPVGPENDLYIRTVIKRSELVIAAWGKSLTTPLAKQRIQQMLKMLGDTPLYCLQMTTCGQYPKHPLYLSGKLKPIPFVQS